MNVSKHTRLLRRRQSLAHSLLYLAAGLIMLLFIGMVGYVVFRGLVRVQSYRGPIAPLFTQVFHYRGREWKLLLNRGNHLSTATLEQILPLLEGQEERWTPLTAQDAPIIRLVLSSEAAAQGLPDQSKKQTVLLVESPAQLLLLLNGYSGAFALVGRDFADRLPSRVKALPVAQHLTLTSQQAIRASRKDPLGRRQLRQLQQQGKTTVDGMPLYTLSPAELAQLGIAPDRPLESMQLQKLQQFWQQQPGAVLLLPQPLSRIAEAHQAEHDFLFWDRNLRLDFFYRPPAKNGKIGGISTILINTLIAVLVTLLLAAPIGLGSAIYLAEYARKGRLVQLVRRMLEILAGLPSIIFGLFGYIFFVEILNLGVGLLSGTLTLAIMIAPTIIRTSEEALDAVPRSYREGSLALGAPKFYTIFRAVLPTATPGILTGILLGLGRAMGETAAVIFTLGTGYNTLATGLGEMIRNPEGLASLLTKPTPSNLAYLLIDYPLLHLSTSMRTLSVHLYWMVINGISFDRGFQTALLLILFILMINGLANAVMRRWAQQQAGG